MTPSPVRRVRRVRRSAILLVVAFASAADLTAPTSAAELAPVAIVEGITEYRLDNGLRDTDPDYAALLLASEIIGGGILNSRLAERIRNQDGLSYAVQSIISGHPVDPAGQFLAVAIFAPENVDRVEAALIEELENRVRSVTLEEVNQAIRDRLDISRLTIVKAGDFANNRATIG